MLIKSVWFNQAGQFLFSSVIQMFAIPSFTGKKTHTQISNATVRTTTSHLGLSVFHDSLFQISLQCALYLRSQEASAPPTPVFDMLRLD